MKNWPLSGWLSPRNHGDDPLEEFIGSFSSNVPGWADQHDRYLGEGLSKEMRAVSSSDPDNGADE